MTSKSLWEESKERYRDYKSPVDFTPDAEAMKASVANLPPVSEERAAFLMTGKETSIMEDISEIGLRIKYNAFLCTSGSPLWDFEEWKMKRNA
jgi:hypothetical protein